MFDPGFIRIDPDFARKFIDDAIKEHRVTYCPELVLKAWRFCNKDCKRWTYHDKNETEITCQICGKYTPDSEQPDET